MPELLARPRASRLKTRRSGKQLIALTLGTVMLLAVVPGVRAQSATDPSIGFHETFDGSPAAPQRWNPADWDVAVHSRDISTWHQLEEMPADHGADCTGPPDTHAQHGDYADAVFSCRNHVMTSINAGGYGAIFLTPDHMVDFSQGEATISVDVSTFRASKRDWWDIWITPYEHNLQAPLESWYPDLAGPPKEAVQVVLNAGNVFLAKQYRNHRETKLPSNWWTPYQSLLSPDRSRRDTLEIRISQGRLKVSMPGYGHTFVDTGIELDWAQGVVQFGHHSYNPSKKEGSGSGKPGTWHWDNVIIDPAVPFTMIGADRRYVDPSSPAPLTLDAPAPADAHLRFSGMGEWFDVRYDGGDWEPAQRPEQLRPTGNGLLFSNYWTPIPEGTRTVEVRGRKGWLPSWIAKDFAVWSEEASDVPVPPTPPGLPSTPGPEPEPTPDPTPPPACPAEWTSCEVPSGLAAHLRSRLGPDAGQAALEAIHAYYEG